METEVEIKTADEAADGILFQPDGKGTFPGVIHLTDIGGIRQSHRDTIFYRIFRDRIPPGGTSLVKRRSFEP